ncbi:Aste57867_4425 [Aphanomyces stellatus]|uniref:Aste57867_4425 protein n=1 Tax=Aphanomyces stellatus TaxID=120398 RepID=A0A485KCS4_9STRA|nr:hypothetical protein As57867_004413 [Aphanomyces stellatus]VFT81536.1 Aste57867_4425 [Aphanomyces stellatus]
MHIEDLKMTRSDALEWPSSPRSSPAIVQYFEDGHEDSILHLVGFLDPQSLVAFSSTRRRARRILLACITTLHLHTFTLPLHVDPVSWLRQFTSIQTLDVRGRANGTNHAIDWLLAGLEGVVLERLRTLTLHRAYCDDSGDPITGRIAALTPVLQHLALVGNGISDTGAMHLANIVKKRVGNSRAACPLQLTLDDNVIGEAGTKALQTLSYEGLCRLSMAVKVICDDAW